MKRQRIIILMLLLLAGLASCSPGHLGSNVIAFIRDGHIWTIDPNGANAFETVVQDTPIIGYNWSPNHQLLAFRALDTDFAKTPAAKHLDSNPITGQVGDVASTANTIGVDGGTPITIAFSSPSVRYSETMWNTTGTRLLYRQTPKSSPQNPASVLWWVSQNDQPGGIAIKTLPDSYSIPSLSYVSQSQLAIGNSDKGVFTTTLAGTHLQYLRRDPLSDHPLPATLERLLWQPAHQDTHILYAIPAPQQVKNTEAEVQLQLLAIDGQITTLATCTCTQFAWSPDGNHILYSTNATYTVLNLIDHSSFDISGVNGSVPYWSPDGQFLLLDGLHTMVLVQVAQRQQHVLLSDGNVSSAEQGTMSAVSVATNALLQPVANSVWAADSRHFLFLTHGRLLWQNNKLSAGRGLYTVTIDSNGHAQGMPAIVDTGNDTQAGWTYQDTNTSFLY